jgi:hypothetical protein
MVAAFDPLGELHLLRRGQERNAADVLEKELKGVGSDLRRKLDLRFRFVLHGDDGDPRLFQGSVELVDLTRLELELIERECDLVGIEAARPIAALEEPLRLIRCEDILDRSPSGRAL